MHKRLTPWLLAGLCCALTIGCDSDPASSPQDLPEEMDAGNNDQPDAMDDASTEDEAPNDPQDAEDQPEEEDLVRVEGGLVRGEVEQDVVSFKGVPFAAPPLGDLRWRPPSPVEPWEGELAATDWPPKCAQLDLANGSFQGQEDCLYLNVWSPVGAADAPVIIFIHGGGNMFGSTSEEGSGVFTYEGLKLARATGAVVVTLQYRVNIMGYLGHPSFDDEVGDGVASANWGLRDQIAALQWVQDNIGAFGGAPDRTLLFGESGGAGSVCGLVGSPAAAGLFGSALMQSGGCGGKTLVNIHAWTQEVAEAVGCPEDDNMVQCLRQAPVEDLVEASSANRNTNAGIALNPAGPTIDGTLLPRSPLGMMLEGEHNHVPLVFGSNAHETAWPFFGIVGQGQRWEQESYEAHVRRFFGSRADAILEVYNVESGDFRNHAEALIALTTDAQFTCPNRFYARAAAATQDAPVYRYLYNHALSGGAVSLLGAFHGLELLYNFQHMEDLEGYEATAEDLKVQQAMAQLWFNLAANGEPGAFDGVRWPQYDAERDTYLEIASPLVSDEGLRTQRCDFWDSL